RLIPHNSPLMSPSAKKWLTFSLRWGIAVVGIWLVIRQISLHDRVWVIQNNQLFSLRLAQDNGGGGEQAGEYAVFDGKDAIPHDQTANKPERKNVLLKSGGRPASLIGVDLTGDL